MTVETLRIATSSDAEEISDLVNRAYRPGAENAGWTHESGLVAGMRTDTCQVTEMISKSDSIILLGIMSERIVACVHVERLGSSVSVGMLAVSPELQEQGLGRWMLAEVERFASKRFKPSKLTMVVVSSRRELVAYYERRGYRRTGAVTSYPAAQGFGTPVSSRLTIEVLEKLVGPALNDTPSTEEAK